MSEILINQISPLQQLQKLQKKADTGGAAGAGGFEEAFKEALSEVDELGKASDLQARQLLQDEVKDVHTAMMALQKADISFQMMMQVRNKLVEAYQEVMRMQV